MKKFLKKFVLWNLKRMAKRRLKSFSGKTIVVTGSVGKTSTKDAIFTVLNSKYRVMRNRSSMNSEFGLLLTILNIPSGYSSAIKWSWLLFMAFLHSFSKIHSDYLLFELGIDKPGDMDYLLSVVKPDITVFTSVAPVHMGEGQFSTLEAIYHEKKKTVDALGDDGVAILNIDNEFVADLAKETKKKVITYGSATDADYKFTGMEESLEGIKFNLTKDGSFRPVECGVVGEYHAYVLLPAIICGELLGVDLEEAIEAVKRYKTPPGRMSVIPAVKGATVLNSS